MNETNFIGELTQYGALGVVCSTLMGMVWWLSKNLLHEIKESRTCIANNTNASTALKESCEKNTESTNRVLEQILQRPCVKGANP